MADIITYPENGITYDADDASGYLSTRLSGVYSADEDFAVTANGGLTVTVSAGQAWVRPARFRGRSIIMEQPETVTLTAADAVRSRIDRLVLRYDAAARKTSLTVLTGTPDSASPTAPEITRTALVYDLCLAEIRRPAGSTVITSADLTDTRADEAVCGLMRDSVTGIPTAQLVEQAKAKVAGLEETATASAQAAEQSAAAAAKSQTAAASSASTATTQARAAAKSATAASTSQSAAAGSASTASDKAQEAASSADAAARDKTAAAGSASASATSAKAAAQSAAEAKAAASTDKTLTMDGAPADAKATGDALAQRYTKEQADAKFGAAYTLPTATASRLGGVKVGDYLDIAPDGTLSGKTLNDKIAAAVAVKSEPRLVWNTTVTAAASNHNMIRSYDIQIPDGVDYVHIKSKSERGDGTEVDIARGGSTYHNLDAGSVATYSTTTFQPKGTLHFQFEKSTNASITFWVTGYHYPTLADLLTQVTAVESSVTDLQVALCELYEEKEGN